VYRSKVLVGVEVTRGSFRERVLIGLSTTDFPHP
jgi:hypothetical protein